MNIPLQAAKLTGELLIMAALGYLARLFGVLDKNAAAKLFRLLTYVCCPLLIIVSFLRSGAEADFNRFGTIFFIALVIHLLATVAALLMFRRKNRGTAASCRFCLVFSGCGFVGLPMLRLIFGGLGAFYGASYLLFSSFYMWFVGQFILSSGKETGFKKRVRTLLHPCLIAAAAGFLLFLFRVRLPRFAISALGTVGDMSSPLAMLILGSMARELPLKSLLFSAEAHAAAFVKLLVLPLAILAVCVPAGISEWTVYTCILMAALPVSVTAPFAAAEYGADRVRALACTVLTGLLSLITLPLLMYIVKSAF